MKKQGTSAYFHIHFQQLLQHLYANKASIFLHAFLFFPIHLLYGWVMTCYITFPCCRSPLPSPPPPPFCLFFVTSSLPKILAPEDWNTFVCSDNRTVSTHNSCTSKIDYDSPLFSEHVTSVNCTLQKWNIYKYTLMNLSDTLTNQLRTWV